jgi:outer membrane protein
MKSILFATTLLGGMACGLAAFAQSPLDMNQPLVGKEAGTFMVRLRAVGLIPEDNSSNISVVGGHVSTTAQALPELDFSYFLTDHIAIEVPVASPRPNIKAIGTAVGDVDVGSVRVLAPTLMLQYHFFPHAAFSPYIGAGISAAFWGTSPALPTVTHFSIGSNVGPVLQVGFDYNVTGHWFLNFDVKQYFLNADAHVDALGAGLRAHDRVDPLLVGAGIGYRF